MLFRSLLPFLAELFNYGLQGKLFGGLELIFIHIYNNTSFLYPQMKAAKTWEGKSGKFTGKCNNCGKVGHREVDCWEKEGNKAKRPTGYRTAKDKEKGGEKAASAVDGGNKTEFLLCGLTFPEETGLLTDPNVWIADT